MWGFLVRRLVQAVVVILIAMTITFVLIRLAPGDPFSGILDNPRISEDVRRQWRSAYGLDRPVHEQYVRYMTSVVRGELGPSFLMNRPVRDAIAEALPNTLLLMAVALAGSFVLGVGIGVVQALRPGGSVDRTLGSGSVFFYAMPDFWLALMLLLIFAYWIPVFPVGGMRDSLAHFLPGPERILDRIRHLVLPAGTLTLLTAAAIARYQRSAMLDVSHEDFVRTARAKGASERSIVARHILRNALLPVITLLGLAFPALLGGAVFIEHVYAWPGMGELAYRAIGARDYYLVTATVITGSVMVVIGSVIADVCYAWADPRLRSR